MWGTEAMSRCLKTLARDEGFTMIEVVIALAILSIGVLGMILGFDSARRLSLVSERHATMAHVAQREIERIEGIPYSQIGLSGTAPTHSTDPSEPDYYVTSGSPPTLQWDRTASSTENINLDPTNG